MSKKLIAAMLALTAMFVCVFAACNTNKGEDEPEEQRPYIDNDEYEFVTDEDGGKMYNEDGEFIVYATEENGDIVTNESGEKVTRNQLFQPFQNGDIFEDYGYRIKVPEGWTSTEMNGVFENKTKNQQAEITTVNKKYAEYYNSNKEFYNVLKEYEGKDSEQFKDLKSVTWEEDIDLGEAYKGVVRFSMVQGEGHVIMYFFENSENIYKVIFRTPSSETAVDESVAFLKAMSFKPFQYYGYLDETTEKQ